MIERSAAVATHPAASEGFLLVRVGAFHSAWPVDQVREVRLPAPLLPDPRLPGFVSGALIVRRRLVPVVDLRERWGSEPSRVGTGRIVLTRVLPFVVGFVVDEVLRVVRGVARAASPDLTDPCAVDLRAVRGALLVPRAKDLEVDQAFVVTPSDILDGDEHAELAALAGASPA